MYPIFRHICESSFCKTKEKLAPIDFTFVAICDFYFLSFLFSVCLETMEIPVDEDWEIERDNLILGETLGEGAFGVVVKAEALNLPSSNSSTVSTVAVKMLKGK